MRPTSDAEAWRRKQAGVVAAANAKTKERNAYRDECSELKTQKEALESTITKLAAENQALKSSTVRLEYEETIKRLQMENQKLKQSVPSKSSSSRLCE